MGGVARGEMFVIILLHPRDFGSKWCLFANRLAVDGVK